MNSGDTLQFERTLAKRNQILNDRDGSQEHSRIAIHDTGITRVSFWFPSWPGYVSWLGFLVVAFSAFGLLLDERTVIWGLSHGLFPESATNALPDTLRRLYLISGAFAIIVTGRFWIWSMTVASRWQPINRAVHRFRAVIALFLSPLARFLRMFLLTIQILVISIAAAVLKPICIAFNFSAMVLRLGFSYLFSWSMVLMRQLHLAFHFGGRLASWAFVRISGLLALGMAAVITDARVTQTVIAYGLRGLLASLATVLSPVWLAYRCVLRFAIEKMLIAFSGIAIALKLLCHSLSLVLMYLVTQVLNAMGLMRTGIVCAFKAIWIVLVGLASGLFWMTELLVRTAAYAVTLCKRRSNNVPVRKEWILAGAA